MLAMKGERGIADIARLNPDETKRFATNTTFMHKQRLVVFFLEFHRTCKALYKFTIQ